MPITTACLRAGVRLAVAAMLTLAVLMAGIGLHPSSHCSGHVDGTADHGVVVQPDHEEPDAGGDGDGFCLGCDCACQQFQVDDGLSIMLLDGEVGCLAHADGPVIPDDVVFEVEPPPVRVS